jgi:hypothetical protein
MIQKSRGEATHDDLLAQSQRTYLRTAAIHRMAVKGSILKFIQNGLFFKLNL